MADGENNGRRAHMHGRAGGKHNKVIIVGNRVKRRAKGLKDEYSGIGLRSYSEKKKSMRPLPSGKECICGGRQQEGARGCPKVPVGCRSAL